MPPVLASCSQCTVLRCLMHLRDDETLSIEGERGRNWKLVSELPSISNLFQLSRNKSMRSSFTVVGSSRNKFRNCWCDYGTISKYKPRVSDIFENANGDINLPNRVVVLSMLSETLSSSSSSSSLPSSSSSSSVKSSIMSKNTFLFIRWFSAANSCGKCKSADEREGKEK